MKCPHCQGTGEIPDGALTRRPATTGGLARASLTPAPTFDHISRIERKIHILDGGFHESREWHALVELRKYLSWIAERDTVSSEELATGYFQAEVKDIAGRHKTIQSLCRLVHRELTFAMVIEKSSVRNETFWTITPFGEKIAGKKRTPRETRPDDVIIDV